MSLARSAAAVERLALSREQLRLALHGPSRPGSGSGGKAAAPWLARVLAIPGIGLVVQAIASWWQQHPLHLAGSVAGDTVKSILKPVVQRNPLGLVLGAVVLGGLVVWTRPWRWLVKPALLTGLLPQLLHEALAQVPLQSVLLALAALGRPKPAVDESPEPTKPGSPNALDGASPASAAAQSQ